MATETSGAAGPGSVEALKRVKATETEWDARLKAAREASESTLHRLRDESDAAVKAAETEGERDRAERVERARAEAAGMSAQILADGQKAAEAAARGEGRRPADKKDAILPVVLGSFGKD
jgi:vacuolar-type H+-ATPase subunit H